MKIKKIEPYKDSRDFFIESWLSESPARIYPIDPYNNLVYQISEFVKYYPPIDIISNWKKSQGKDLVYYWYEENKLIILGAEFEITKQSLIINYVAKNSNYKSNPPYASELYKIVLKDLVNYGMSIRVDSDKSLSDEGFKIWTQLLKQGHTIHVYDKTANSGKSFTKINSIDDLKKYFNDDPDFKKYRYTLTESNSGSIVHLNARFNLKKFREENNY
jgi:hypothetical protein